VFYDVVYNRYPNTVHVGTKIPILLRDVVEILRNIRLVTSIYFICVTSVHLYIYIEQLSSIQTRIGLESSAIWPNDIAYRVRR
jgi:hypothetical protein